LWVSWVGYYGIRADKPPYRSIVITRIIVVKAGSVKPLPGKLLIRGHGAGAGAAKGQVLHGGVNLSAGAVRHQGGAGKAVLVDIAEGAVLAGGYQLPAQVIAAGGVAGGEVHFIVFVDIDNRLAVFNLLNAVAVTVIEELRDGSAVIRDRCWLVFHVPGKRLSAAGYHVAVGIIGIAFSADGRYSVGLGAVGVGDPILRKNIAYLVIGVALRVKPGGSGGR